PRRQAGPGRREARAQTTVPGVRRARAVPRASRRAPTALAWGTEANVAAKPPGETAQWSRDGPMVEPRSGRAARAQDRIGSAVGHVVTDRTMVACGRARRCEHAGTSTPPRSAGTSADFCGLLWTSAQPLAFCGGVATIWARN